MESSDWRDYSEYSFENGFPDIANVPFREVYVSRPKFVKFALIWTQATGMYKKFQIYCRGREKHEKLTPVQLEIAS